MARYTTFNPKENLGGGITNRWQVTRYKYNLGALTCTTADVGGSNDYGVDPTAAAILSAGVTPTTTICTFPTHREWSAGVEGMLFWVEIEGNTAANLTVDLEFYEAVYGSTGIIESYRLIAPPAEGKGHGDVIGIETDGEQVFVRVSGITNPDSSASLYLSCKRASRSFASLYAGGGGASSGLIVDEGLSPVGNYVWDGSDWVRAAGSAAGATTVVQPTASLLNCTEASAASILTSVQLIDDAVGTHDAAAPTKNLLQGYKASAGVPAAVADGDDVSARADLTGSAGVHMTNALNYTNDSATTYEAPPTGGDEGTVNVAAAATQFTAVSTPCVRVHGTARLANVGIVKAGFTNGILITTGVELQPGDGFTFETSNVANCWAIAANANDDIDFAWETR